MSDSLQTNHPRVGRYCMLIAGLVLIAVLCATPTVADTNQTITLNPIGEHAGGEKINISGTTSIEKCKQIGIEIIPKNLWDSVCSFAKEGTGRVVFNPVAITKENIHPAGINLVRFNADGTQSQQNLDIPKNHVLVTGTVVMSGQKDKTWSVVIENGDDKKPLTPGTYHVNIWDATNQKENSDNPLPNGWDITNQKIYPSTPRVNIWDPANQKDLQYAELIIK